MFVRLALLSFSINKFLWSSIIPFITCLSFKVFLVVEMYKSWLYQLKSASFSTDNGRTSRLSGSFYGVSNHKNFIPKYLDNVLTDFAKTSRTSRRLLGEKLPWTILEEAFPVPRNTAAGKIGNGVISLVWQLRCHNHFPRWTFSSAINTRSPISKLRRGFIHFVLSLVRGASVVKLSPVGK